MLRKIFLILISLFFSLSVSTYGIGEDTVPDSTNHNEFQMGLLVGYIASSSVGDVHGNHGLYDTEVEGIVIDQSWCAGINVRYYFNEKFGIHSEILYSNAKFPEQDVALNGYPIHQPKSDLQLFTISAGPAYRFIGKGIWEKLNPYAAALFSGLVGYASDVNFTTTYGRGGYSAITGIGFNVQLGGQYHFNNFVLSLEYRYEYLSSKVYYFRSFTEGLDFVKSTSYIITGINFLL